MTKPKKQINVGDVVYLASGSPKLTVLSIIASLTEGPGDNLMVGWFVYDTAEYRTASVPRAALTDGSSRSQVVPF